MKRMIVSGLAASLCLLAIDCRDESHNGNGATDMSTVAEDLSAAAPDLTAEVDLAGADLAAPPPPAEFVVLRVGDGAAALGSAATAAFIERRKVSDGSMVGSPIALPTTVAAPNFRLTLGGSTTSEGALSRSADGKYVLVGGYDAALGTASVGTSTSSTVSRVIGRIDAAGNVDTSTAADFFSGGNIRSATSSDGKALWAAGPNGIVYTTFGSTAKPTSLLTTNMRWLQVIGGQLFGSSASGTAQGINQIGTGLPTTTATATLLSGFSAQTSTSHYGFVAFDRDATPGIDVMYVADDRATAAGGGIQRWRYSGTQWSLEGTMAKGLTAGARGIAGFQSGNNIVLLVTTAETQARVVTFVDDGTAIDMLPSTPLATAATNTAYRGIALAPQ